VSARRQIPPKPHKQAKLEHADTGTYGARVNQLFQEAIRDLEALKQASRQEPVEPTSPA
jgi:hypothetical protein